MREGLSTHPVEGVLVHILKCQCRLTSRIRLITPLLYCKISHRSDSALMAWKRFPPCWHLCGDYPGQLWIRRTKDSWCRALFIVFWAPIASYARGWGVDGMGRWCGGGVVVVVWGWVGVGGGINRCQVGEEWLSKSLSMRLFFSYISISDQTSKL